MRRQLINYYSFWLKRLDPSDSITQCNLIVDAPGGWLQDVEVTVRTYMGCLFSYQGRRGLGKDMKE